MASLSAVAGEGETEDLNPPPALRDPQLSWTEAPSRRGTAVLNNEFSLFCTTFADSVRFLAILSIRMAEEKHFFLLYSTFSGILYMIQERPFS